MARLNFEAVPRALDGNGDPVSGAYLYVYEAGTTTQVTTYSDDEMTVAHAWPIVADAEGYFAQVYVPNGDYKVRCTTSGGTVLYEADDISQGETSVLPAIFILGAGQSNIASSNAQAAGGDLTSDPRIQLWNGSAFAEWTPATGMGVGAAGRNSILFQAAKEAIRQGYPKVYCVNDGHAGQAISYWTGSGTSSAGYVSLKGQMDAAIADSAVVADGITEVFAMTWGQGESDGGASFDVDTYQTSFETLKTQLRAESWFATDTPITCLEMPSLGSATIVNRYFVGTVQYDADPYTATTRTKGLDDGADNLHWTGNAMNTIGARAFKTVLHQISPAMPTQTILDGEQVHFRLEGVNGKGVGMIWTAAQEQVTLGSMSDTTYPGIASPSITWDINDGWVRLDSYAYSLTTHEMLSGLIFKSYNGGDFTDITDAVNTDSDKKEGMAYWDAANDRLVVANGTGGSATWSYFVPDGTYTPV